MTKLNEEKIKNLINFAYKVGWASNALKIEKLIENDDLEQSNRIMYAQAVDDNNLEVMKYLIKEGLDINVDNGYILRMSCVFGNKEMIKLLLKNKVNIHIKEKEPFISAVTNGEIDIVRMLWKVGKKQYLANEKILETAFFTAAQYGHLNMIKYMVEELRLTDPIFITKVLKKASSTDKLSIVEYLVSHGGDVYSLREELNIIYSEKVKIWCDKYIETLEFNKQLDSNLPQKEIEKKPIKIKM